MTLVEKFHRIEGTLARKHGGFSLFGLFERSDMIGKWDIVAAAPWLGTDRAAITQIAEAVVPEIASEEWSRITHIVPLRPTDEFVRDIGLLYPTEHGMRHIPSIVLSGIAINRGVIITANPEAARVAETAPVAA